jgi:LPS O-antigen subunit length determinant protein (WzzB/FepE family)
MSRKIEEKIAKEHVFLIKESISMRKREIVDEIKALRENFRVKSTVNPNGGGVFDT